MSKSPRNKIKISKSLFRPTFSEDKDRKRIPKEKQRASKSKMDLPLNCGVEVSSRAELHHFAPILILILNEINSFHDVGVVQHG